MSVYDLLTDASTTGPSDLVNVGRVTPITFVVETSSDFVPNASQPTVVFEEAEFDTDTPPAGATNNLPALAENTGTAGVQPTSLVAGAKQVYHIAAADWLALRANIVNAPSAGTLSVRLYVPDGR